MTKEVLKKLVKQYNLGELTAYIQPINNGDKLALVVCSENKDRDRKKLAEIDKDVGIPLQEHLNDEIDNDDYWEPDFKFHATRNDSQAELSRGVFTAEEWETKVKSKLSTLGIKIKS